MRRSLFLLGLLLMVLPVSGWGQQYSSSYSQLMGSDGNLYGLTNPGAASNPVFSVYSPATGQTTNLNTTMPSATLCFETPGGTFWGIASVPPAVEVFQITTAGVFSALGKFPSWTSTDIDYMSCPVIANDGNYYGSTSGGAYNYGYLYQVTAEGVVHDIYDFTNTIDGYAPSGPGLQASDGDLYFGASSNLLRYSASAGVKLLPLSSLSYGASFTGPFVEASDGNFYNIYDGYDNQILLQVTPSGTAQEIYTAPQTYPYGSLGLFLQGDGELAVIQAIRSSECSSYESDYLSFYPVSLAGVPGPQTYQIGTSTDYDVYYELSPVFLSGNGSYYGLLGTYYLEGLESGACETDDIVSSELNVTPSPAPTPPISLSFSKTHILTGGSSTLTWKVNNAYSDTMQQCYGYAGLTGSMAPQGKVPLSGSQSVQVSEAGTYQASIVCGGTEAATVAVNAGDAALTLSSSATTVPVGSSVTLTGTISVGSPLPTGSVSFYYGNTLIGSGSLNSSGVATLTANTAGIALGTYSVTARYAGDANYGPATTSPLSITLVAKSATTLGLTPATQSVVSGGPKPSFTATVTGNMAGHQPTGTVTFLSGSTVLGTALLEQAPTYSDATFSASAAGVPAGKYPVTASYPGDSWNNASTSSAVTVIVQADSVAVTAAPNPVPANTAVTLTATASGTVTPTGTVIFYAGTTGLGSNALSGGVASITVPAGTLTAGSYQVTAYYAGDKNNPAVTSPAVTLTVQ